MTITEETQTNSAREQYLLWTKGNRVDIADLLIRCGKESDSEVFDVIMSEVSIPFSNFGQWNFLFELIAIRYKFEYVEPTVGGSVKPFVQGSIMNKLFGMKSEEFDTVEDELFHMIKYHSFWCYLCELTYEGIEFIYDDINITAPGIVPDDYTHGKLNEYIAILQEQQKK